MPTFFSPQTTNTVYWRRQHRTQSSLWIEGLLEQRSALPASLPASLRFLTLIYQSSAYSLFSGMFAIKLAVSRPHGPLFKFDSRSLWIPYNTYKHTHQHLRAGDRKTLFVTPIPSVLWLSFSRLKESFKSCLHFFQNDLVARQEVLFAHVFFSV
jgi:hypothetical protein